MLIKRDSLMPFCLFELSKETIIVSTNPKYYVLKLPTSKDFAFIKGTGFETLCTYIW